MEPKNEVKDRWRQRAERKSRRQEVELSEQSNHLGEEANLKFTQRTDLSSSIPMDNQIGDDSNFSIEVSPGIKTFEDRRPQNRPKKKR